MSSSRSIVYSVVFFFTFFTLITVVTRTPKSDLNKTEKDTIEHILIDSVTTATVYNATVRQCNSNPSKPANYRFTIDLERPGEHKIIAMERTMRAKYGLKYGDIVYIEGTNYDGYWQIQDCMNKRFKGQSRIDLLMNNDITLGKWENVRIYKIICSKEKEQEIRSEFLASL